MQWRFLRNHEMTHPEEVDHHHTAEQAESMTKYWQIFENNRWHWIRRSSCDDHDDLTEQHEKWWECHHKNTATTTSPTSSSLFILSFWIGMLLLRPTTTTCALSQLKCTATTVCLWELQPPIYCHRSARSPSNGKDRMANFHPIFLLVFVTSNQSPFLFVIPTVCFLGRSPRVTFVASQIPQVALLAPSLDGWLVGLGTTYLGMQPAAHLPQSVSQ